MSGVYNRAIIGNGTTAVNALDALVKKYRASASVLPPICLTIFGAEPEEECGKGFAYGRIGGRVGHLTESPDHADYGNVKGEFRRYAAEILNKPADLIRRVSRKLVGDFHSVRYTQVKNEAEEVGISIAYKEAWVADVARADNGLYRVLSANHSFGGFDHVTLAVGDVLSTHFNEAAQTHPGKVFRTPYEAIQTILDNNDANTIVVARGTRSSFVDLVNPLRENGYKGSIIGLSPSGSISWQTQEGAEPYIPKILSDDSRFDTVFEVITALRDELALAQQSGAYIPVGLTQFDPAKTDKRLGWDFDLKSEAAHASGLTYHQVSHAVKWEKIYENLRDDEERRKFTVTLSDFIVYNRVNIIVAEDYEKFIEGIESGKVEIRRSGFNADNIRFDAGTGRLVISPSDGRI